MRLAIFALVPLLLHCTTKDNGGFLAPDAAADEGVVPDGAMVVGDAAKACGCSADMHAVIDCDGNVLQTCNDSQGCAGGVCIPACDAANATKSSVGCEYFAHDPHMGYGKGCYAVFVANTWTAPVTLGANVGGTAVDIGAYAYIPSGSKWPMYAPIGTNGSIPVGKVAIVFVASDIDVPCPKPAIADSLGSAWGDAPSDTRIGGQVLRLTANAPVVMHDIQPYGGGKSAITDASLLLPTSTWGTNYVAITPRPLGNGTDPAIAIVASQDDTTVTMRPTANVTGGNGIPSGTANMPMSFKLARGQVARIAQPTDLLGSIISSDKPIGLWGEQDLVSIDNASAGDSIHEQIPPISALGSEYVYARYRDRLEGTDETPPTRIVGVVDGTKLTWEPAPPAGAQMTIDEGKAFDVRSSGPFIVRSQDDKHPFYVATYMTSGGPFDWRGDPEMVNVVAGDQFLSRYSFFTDPTYSETNLVFIRRAGKDGKFKDVTLDCAGVLVGWQPIGTGGKYEFTRRDLVRHDFVAEGTCDNGFHKASSDAPFGLTVWGWGTKEAFCYDCTLGFVSYAYPAGQSVRGINPVIVPTSPK